MSVILARKWRHTRRVRNARHVCRGKRSTLHWKHLFVCLYACVCLMATRFRIRGWLSRKTVHIYLLGRCVRYYCNLKLGFKVLNVRMSLRDIQSFRGRVLGILESITNRYLWYLYIATLVTKELFKHPQKRKQEQQELSRNERKPHLKSFPWLKNNLQNKLSKKTVL